MRLLFIADFTEQFAYRLLRGIFNYSKRNSHWVVCKMSPSYKRKVGIDGVLAWAKEWRADVVISPFEPDDDVTIFRKNGIVALALDYISRFDTIPNITGDYDRMGNMAASHFLAKGFENFAFFGYNGICWSEERCEGFRKRIAEAGYGDNLYVYDRQHINTVWYDPGDLNGWLMSLPKPIAIMAVDDTQGSILMQACSSCGLRIPFDVAIVGVDNDEIMCNMSDPAMSTINVDIERGGYDAAAMAEKMVQAPTYSGEDIVMKPLGVIERVSSSVLATNDKEVLKALTFIHANVDRKIQVTDVLEHVPLSRRLLEQRFKDMTGMTIYNYISVKRMERFAQLLLSCNDPVSDIASRMDEFDTKSISRRFKAIKGCTPSEYRKKKLRK